MAGELFNIFFNRGPSGGAERGGAGVRGGGTRGVQERVQMPPKLQPKKFANIEKYDFFFNVIPRGGGATGEIH